MDCLIVVCKECQAKPVLSSSIITPAICSFQYTKVYYLKCKVCKKQTAKVYSHSKAIELWRLLNVEEVGKTIQKITPLIP